MIRFASVRYDDVLGLHERDEVVRALRSTGADVTSWNTAAGRTYARVRFDSDSRMDALGPVRSDARIDVPPLAVFRIEPERAHRLPSLWEALAGAGRPAGVLDVRRDGTVALVVEFDCRRTPPALLVALVDVELGAASGRRIEPLIALDDDVLASFAGALLREPDLDASHLIETHLDPLLARSDA